MILLSTFFSLLSHPPLFLSSSFSFSSNPISRTKKSTAFTPQNACIKCIVLLLSWKNTCICPPLLTFHFRSFFIAHFSCIVLPFFLHSDPTSTPLMEPYIPSFELKLGCMKVKYNQYLTLSSHPLTIIFNSLWYILSLAVLWRPFGSELFGPSSGGWRKPETRRGRAVSDIKLRGQHAVPSDASECGIPTVFPFERAKLSNTSEAAAHEEAMGGNSLHSKNGSTSASSIGARELCDTWHVGDAVTSEVRKQWTPTPTFNFMFWESELWVQPGTTESFTNMPQISASSNKGKEKEKENKAKQEQGRCGEPTHDPHCCWTQPATPNEWPPQCP